MERGDLVEAIRFLFQDYVDSTNDDMQELMLRYSFDKRMQLQLYQQIQAYLDPKNGLS